MVEFTRKGFLGLTAAAAAAGGLGACATSAQPAQVGPARRTLIRGADLLTMDPQLGEALATDVLLDGGRIAAIGRDLAADDAEVIDAAGMILMPGMSDGHRHVWEGLEAGRLVKTEARRYATYQDWKKRVMVCFTPEDHYLGGYIGGLQAIDSGVTTLLDYAHVQHTLEKSEAAARGLKDSGVGGWYCHQVSHSPTYGPGDTLTLAQANAEQRATADENHWRIAEHVQSAVLSDTDAPLQMGVAISVGAFGQPIGVVGSELERARAMGVRMIAAHSHRPDTPYPAGHFGARDSGVRDLHEAGLLGPDFHLSHGNQLTEDELALMRETGVMLCSTAMGEFPYPAAGRGVSSHGRARRAGVAAGIGIDVTVALAQDYFEHARAAFWSLYLSPEGRDIATEYKSEDTLDFATRLGARAIRLGDVAGAISVGKRADLVLLNTDKFGFAMIGSLADRVLNFAGLPDVDSVWVAGRAFKRNGRMIGVDWTALKQRLEETQERVAAQAATITFT